MRERDIFTPHSAFYQTKQPPGEKRTIHYKTKLSSDPGKWVFNLPIAGIHSDEPNEYTGRDIIWAVVLSYSLKYPWFLFRVWSKFYKKRERERKRKKASELSCPLAGQSRTLHFCKLQSSGEFSPINCIIAFPAKVIWTLGVKKITYCEIVAIFNPFSWSFFV